MILLSTLASISEVVLFDGRAEPIPVYVYAAAAGAVAALAGCLIWRLSGRVVTWYVPLVIALIGIFAGAVPVWDQLRLRQLAASGGLTVSRGTVTQVWHIATRTRDMSSNSLRYKTTISEGFDVGAERFSWKSGSCLSTAALCNLAKVSQPIVEGMQVEVHWFKDAAQGDENRVVLLRRL